MDQRQKKTTRDLSDLKSRLGIAKPAAAQPAPAQAPAPAAATTPARVGTGPNPATTQSGPIPTTPLAPPRVAPPGVVMPPPGMVVPPPGVAAPYAQVQAPPPDPKRDPFAASAAQRAYQPIVDAGPPLEIPQEKKSHGKLIIALIITALVPLGVGWACGRIYGARVLFNKAIDDAKQITEEVHRISEANRKIAKVLFGSQERNEKRIVFDQQMIDAIKDVLRNAPNASPDRARKQQDQLFRTNYAMMDDIVINRLFNYYNNSIRLYEGLETFIQRAERSKELIETYSREEGKSAQQRYGIVFAEDSGQYFLGSLVEVGNIDCAKEVAPGKECKKEDVKGFMVRTPGGSWSPRPGKPEGKQGKVTDIVVPIIPDESWKQVAVGKRGYLPFNEYKRNFLDLLGICALLARDEKPLTQDLGKQAGRLKVFAPL